MDEEIFMNEMCKLIYSFAFLLSLCFDPSDDV